MIEMAKFNLNVILKRKNLINILMLTPVIAFILTLIFYRSIRNLEMIGNPVYSFFFFNERQNGFSNILLITLPLICSLFYGDYFYYEKSFLHEIVTRGKKDAYYFTNALFAFIAGFLIVAFFIGSMFLFNFIITNNPEHTLSYFSMGINENDPGNHYWWLHQLFYEQPYVYIVIRSLTISLFAGFLALTTYSVSLFVKAKILTYMSTMIITLMLSIALGLLIPKLGNWATTVSFKPSSTIVLHHEMAILFWYIILAGISCVLIYIKCRKEVLE